jgi:hypothetical protein
MLRANGGTYANPMGFPGYDSLYSGSYQTYRWVMQHPIVQLVDAIAVGPILTSEWEYEKSDKRVPDSDVELVRSNLDPIRTQLLQDFFRVGRRYGWAGGEPRWEISQRGSETRLVAVKPLLHDITEILKDRYGNPTGLVNYRVPEDSDKTEVRLPFPYKGFLYTYDSYAGDPYGRSWLENIRATAWKDWLDAAQQLQLLGAKIAGITSVVISPPGEFLDEQGNRVSYRKNAEIAIGAIADGAAGVWFPSIALAIDEKGNIDAIKLMAELAGKSLTSIETLDFGNNAPAIKGQLERMIHAEELIFAGGLRPSRSGLQGSSGGDRGQS